MKYRIKTNGRCFVVDRKIWLGWQGLNWNSTKSPDWGLSGLYDFANYEPFNTEKAAVEYMTKHYGTQAWRVQPWRVV